MSPATVADLQSRAGNRAVGALFAGPATVQRIGLGFLGDLLDTVGGLLDSDGAEPLQKSPGTCSEQPTTVGESPVPVTITADSALEFSQKMKDALAGFPHMQPSFQWTPEIDSNGKITRVNLKVTTKIVRPRYGGGRGDSKEVALIRKLEELIKGHEERHRDIAKDFAARAVCAALGKSEKTYEAAIKAAMCQMNKAQEALDHREGTVRWTLEDGGTRVADVGLAPEPSASYPCDAP